MKIKHICILLSLLFLMLCLPIWNSSAASGGSYFVSVSGKDSNPGTLGQPFRTVQKGCDVLKPGDTLYIREGRYNEKVVVSVSGTRDAKITISNYGSERAILDGTGVNGRTDILRIENRSYLTINGLELCNSNSGDTPTGIMVEGYGDSISLLNNKVYSIKSNDNAHGIAAYGTNGSKSIYGLVIQGNEVYNCILGSSESVVVNGNVEFFRINGNTIHDNNNIGIDCIGFERTASNNDQARNGFVRGNTVYNISSAKNPAYRGEACADGIYVDGGKDIIIDYNRVYSCDIGIEEASEHIGKTTSGVTVRNNIIYGSTLYGLSFGGSSSRNGYAEKCSFLNNTLYNNHVGINIQKSQNNLIQNNIIYDTGTLLAGQVGANTLKNNLWFSPKCNMAGLKLFGDPCFVNPEIFDFHLRGTSPAINAGSASYSPADGETDFDGKPRINDGRVDCGAYEYTKIAE